MDNKGRHVIADIYLREWPGDGALVAACEQAIEQSKMNVVSATVKKFKPQGMTAVWILEESHFSIHTYPEHNYLSVDCYTCGTEGRPDVAIAALLAGMDVAQASVQELERGAVEA